MHGESENHQQATARNHSTPDDDDPSEASNLDRTIMTPRGVTRIQMGTLDRVMEAFGEDDARPEYACLACENGYDVQHHVCPECGGYSVERIDW